VDSRRPCGNRVTPLVEVRIEPGKATAISLNRSWVSSVPAAGLGYFFAVKVGRRDETVIGVPW
jgi:hypothetical protein